MALVRISKQFLDDVRRQVTHLQDMEKGSVPYYETEFPDDLGARKAAEEVLWGEHLHLRDLMPAAWMKTVEVTAFRTRHTHSDLYIETTSEIFFRTPGLPLPPYAETSYRYTHNQRETKVGVEVPFEAVQAAANNPDNPMHFLATRLMAVVAYEQQTRSIRRQWEARAAGLLEFFGKCKSLNEALKLWPECRMYVPKDYLETADMPVVRPKAVSRKEAVLKSIDTEGITAAAVAARLQGLL